MKITVFAFAAASLMSTQPAISASFAVEPSAGVRLVPVQDETQRTITSQPNPSLGSRGNGLGIEGGPTSSPSIEPRSRIRPYRWKPGAEILDNRDLGLGLVDPDPLQSDPLIGDPTLDGQDSGTTGSTTTSPLGGTSPSLGTVPSIGSSPPIGSSSSTGAPTTGSGSIGSAGSLGSSSGSSP